MFVTVTVARYSGINTVFGFLSMAVLRVLLFFKKYKIQFSKLMGSGKNGTFDIEPDLGQWAYLWVWKNQEDYTNFLENSGVMKYIRKYSSENFTLFLKPMQSRGLWDNQNPFVTETKSTFAENEPIVVLTRASIRPHKAADFWRNVPAVAHNFSENEGFVYSIGVGEMPFFKQATISIWKNESAMKAFAYRGKEHAQVIRKTHSEDWYSEELFARFSLVGHTGDMPAPLLQLYV